jgi:hypothetical protein
MRSVTVSFGSQLQYAPHAISAQIIPVTKPAKLKNHARYRAFLVNLIVVLCLYSSNIKMRDNRMKIYPKIERGG